MSILETNDLWVTIGGMDILRGVSVVVKAGEKVGLIGPNGCGKSTFFNSLNGFQLPARGSVRFKGADISTFQPHQRALLGLSRVFQNFGIFREMTLLENILVALEAREPFGSLCLGKKRASLRRAATDILSTIGLGDKLNDKAGSLSGGQMRLLEISRSIAVNADLFLLDEPTAGVSPKMKLHIEKALRQILDLKRTILIIEHDINFIHSLCDRILVMDSGRIIMDDTPANVRKDPLLQELYFGQSGVAP